MILSRRYMEPIPVSRPQQRPAGREIGIGRSLTSRSSFRNPLHYVVEQETAPHILAALQAQRERVAQQQANDSARGVDNSDDNTFAFLKRQQRPPQQTSLPGFLFDKEHGRFFKLVRGGAAHPAQVAATQRPARGPLNLGESRALAGGAPKVSPAEEGRVGHKAIRKRGQGLHAYVVHRRTGWFGDSSWNREYLRKGLQRDVDE